MKRTAGVLVLLAALGGGCVSDKPGPYMGSYFAAQNNPGGPGGVGGVGCASHTLPSVPGVQGPWGQPVGMIAPYTSAPPSGEQAAREMLALNMPLNAVQQAGLNAAAGSPSGVVRADYNASPNAGSGIQQTAGPPPGMLPGALPPPAGLSPPGVPVMPGGPAGHPVPGMGGLPGGGMPGGLPGGGMPQIGPPIQMGGPRAPGAVAAVGALVGPAPGAFPASRTQIFFTNPPGMKISWFAPTPDGKTGFTPDSIEAPGRYNFLQAAIYRLRLTDIPNRANLELYPTLEVVPCNHKTSDFLAHSAVPISFTDDDFEQVASGNYVIKVIYLPDPMYQGDATTGPSELVSSRLEPGVDPIAEACRRGSILAVVRIGYIDLSLAHSPGMEAPNPYMAHPPMPPGMGPMMPGMGPMMPGMGPMMPGMGPMGPGGAGNIPPGMGPMGPGFVGMMPPGMGPMGPGMARTPGQPGASPTNPVNPAGPLPGSRGGVPPIPVTQPGQQPGPFPASGAGTPLSKGPETSTSAKPAEYSTLPPVPTPAEMAGQSPESAPAEKKSSGGSHWIIPGMDSKP